MDHVLDAHPVLPTRAPRAPRAPLWIGRTLTGLIAAFLLLDAVLKLIPLAVVVEGTEKVGYPVDVIRPLGVVLLVSTLLHLVRRTELLGALLLTAYLGGATATHVRTGTPFWMPVAMGALLWGAYALRSPALRAFVQTTTRAPAC